LPHRHLALILGALAAIGPLSIDMYLPAFPALGAALGADAAAVQGTLASYFAGLALGQAVSGPLADRFGRRAPLFIGLVLYAAASIACALATGIGALTALRFAQALGGCTGMVIARAVVRDLTEGREAIRLMARLTLVMGVAPILAPMLGGWLLGAFGWRSIFWALALYGLVLLALVGFALPESLPRERRRRDGLAAVLAVYGGLLADRRFMGNTLATALPIGGMFAYIAGSPFVFMQLHGVTPGHYALLFGANAAGIILASQLAPRLAQRMAPARLLDAALLAATVAGTALLLAAATGAAGFAGIAAPLFVYVASLGVVMPLAVTLAMAQHGRVAGSASAVIGTLQFGAGAVAGLLVGALHDGTALPMALLVAAGGAGGWAARRLLVPRGA
jgi:DHA1 family bicyclomycin/chloramphenicol resistance-like MFS transporter